MLYYARSDTHYLLYIYDRVRNDLVSASDRNNPDTDYIGRALGKSRELSLYRHEHPSYNERTGEGSRGWHNFLLKRLSLGLDSDQFSTFRALWKWRDDTARKEDESPQFVLATAQIAEISRFSPPDVKALHSLLPLNAPLARQRVSEIWGLIQESRSENGPTLLHFFTSLVSDPSHTSERPKSSEKVEQVPMPDVDVTVNKLPKSQLFGSMPISSRWEESKEKLEKLDNHIPFPWQRFVEQDSIKNALSSRDDQALAGNKAESGDATSGLSAVEDEPTPIVDEEFTLKRGIKRKVAVPKVDGAEQERQRDLSLSSSSSSSTSSSSCTSSEEEPEGDLDVNMDADHDTSGMIPVLDDDTDPKTRRRQKREEKKRKRKAEEQRILAEAKAARKAKREEKRKAEKRQKEMMMKEEPFDYSNAQSVMHASRQVQADAADAGGKKGKKRAFDPYGKMATEDEIQGARKAPPIKGERSATFKK